MSSDVMSAQVTFKCNSRYFPFTSRLHSSFASSTVRKNGQLCCRCRGESRSHKTRRIHLGKFYSTLSLSLHIHLISFEFSSFPLTSSLRHSLHCRISPPFLSDCLIALRSSLMLSFARVSPHEEFAKRRAFRTTEKKWKQQRKWARASRELEKDR